MSGQSRLPDVFASLERHFTLSFSVSVLSSSNSFQSCRNDFKNVIKAINQLTFTCFKSPIQKIEKGVKYVQS